MVVGGPNARTDYHWDEGPEFFYQLEGEMVLHIQEDGAVARHPDPRRRDVSICRRACRIRRSATPTRSAWSSNASACRTRRTACCGSASAATRKLYEEFFHLRDIETDFPPVFDRFYSSRDHRTCRECGHVNPAPARYVMPDT